MPRRLIDTNRGYAPSFDSWPNSSIEVKYLNRQTQVIESTQLSQVHPDHLAPNLNITPNTLYALVTDPIRPNDGDTSLFRACGVLEQVLRWSCHLPEEAALHIVDHEYAHAKQGTYLDKESRFGVVFNADPRTHQITGLQPYCEPLLRSGNLTIEQQVSITIAPVVLMPNQELSQADITKVYQLLGNTRATRLLTELQTRKTTDPYRHYYE